MIHLEGLKSDLLSPAFKVGNLIYTSGQVGIDFETGKIGKDIQEQTKIALNNIKKTLKNAGANMDDVIKVTIFIQDLADFEKMNSVYVTFFNEPRPARSCVGVKLARPEFKVEIEVVAYKP